MRLCQATIQEERAAVRVPYNHHAALRACRTSTASYIALRAHLSPIRYPSRFRWAAYFVWRMVDEVIDTFVPIKQAPMAQILKASLVSDRIYGTRTCHETGRRRVVLVFFAPSSAYCKVLSGSSLFRLRVACTAKNRSSKRADNGI